MKKTINNPERAPRQRRQLSQVFLKETWPAARMTELVADWQAQIVLEIGPGDGVLTELLLDTGMEVCAVEKDERFGSRLKARWGDRSNFELIEGDVLDFRLDQWLEQHAGKKIVVVGNIPYSISSPILKWVLPFLNKLCGVGLMTQLEFAERLASVPDQKSYGSLTVFTQMRADVEMVCSVPKEVFKPVPKVDSAIVKLEFKPSEYSTIQLRRIETITRAAFTQRRKKLRNGIKPWLNKLGEGANLSIDLERRPGTLTIGEFQQLAKEIFPEDF